MSSIESGVNSSCFPDEHVINHMEIYSDEKREFFPAMAMSVVLYGCTTWKAEAL